MGSNHDPARQRIAVTLLARVPERGRVKTRLAATLGDAAALAVHETLLLDVIDRVAAWLGRRPGRPGRPAGHGIGAPPALGRALHLALTGSPEARTEFADQLAAGSAHVRVEEQSGGDLGDRIEEAFARRAAEAPGGAGLSLVIGSDCPFLSDDLLEEAVACLLSGSASAVLAPARDGGFVLMGAGRLPPGSLSGIEWGSERVLAQTRDRLQGLGLSPALIREEEDIDCEESLWRSAPRLEADPSLAPRTLAWLRAHGGPRPAPLPG